VAVKVVDQAFLAPLYRPRGRLSRIISWYGLNDAAGRKLTDWPLLNSLDTSLARRRPWPIRRADDRLRDEAVFGGVFYSTFAHFMSETVPNLVAARRVLQDYPGRKVVFFLPPNLGGGFQMPAQHAYHVPLLDRIGIDRDDMVFVTAPLQVDRLIVGPSPFPRKFRFAPWLLSDLDALFPVPRGVQQRVYLSRQRWTHKPRVADEDRIAALFHDHGYHIIHPQEMTLEHQFETIFGAEHLAGPQGFALHWSLYSRHCRSVISLGWPSPVQNGICASRVQVYENPPGKRPRGAAVRVRGFRDDTLVAALARVHGAAATQ
jgi:hypothetical protein